MKRKQSFSLGSEECVPLAVVGLAFQFPQDAVSEETFWQMLSEGRSASTDFPQDRLNIDALYHPDDDRPSSIPIRGGHFLKEDLGTFDAPFFSITPSEAACIDPQHRKLLQTAYHALEDAGIPIHRCSGSKTSVYTGCFTTDYASILQQDYQEYHKHAVMGISMSMLANRLSWFFNFKGTSMNVDSACSSSLLAFHLACQDLRAGNSSMAVVGGANLLFHPNFMKLMANFNFLSKDSRCWSFDEKANGYARGEGTAVVIVKRLDDALRDGDTIRAVIRNTGSNQDGRTPAITQPSLESQVALIRQTFEQGNIDMEPTRFFEAHGTGTPIGDPVEANAIGNAFSQYLSAENPLYIGAVKASIGHLEGCSGLAGLIKTILVLENGVIPPIAGFELLNTRIDAKRLHLKFPTESVSWPTCGLRRACVNSFGVGGTNALVILDDAYHFLKLKGHGGFHRTRQSSYLANNVTAPMSPPILGKIINGWSVPEMATRHSKLVVWSAPDKAGAQRLSHSYEKYLKCFHTSRIDDLAYTLIVRKSQFCWRSFMVMQSHTEQQHQDQLTYAIPVKASNEPRACFLFTGQGAQYLGMGRSLFGFPIFRQSICISDKHLREYGCSWSLLDIMDGPRDQVDIDKAEFSQPVTTCLQIALVDLLESFGITPSVVVGHSSGEIAAAYATGALSHSSAVKVAYYRGILSSAVAAEKDGLAMMAVGLSRDGIAPYFQRLWTFDSVLDVDIGCVNSPNSITLTGKLLQLKKLEGWLKQDKIFVRQLHVPVAYHSRFMKTVANRYAAAIGSLEGLGNSKSPVMISSVTGDFVASQTLATAEYWVQNLISTVEFAASVHKLLVSSTRPPRRTLGKKRGTLSLQVTHLLELGPHSALQGPIRESLLKFQGSNKPVYVPSLVRNRDALISLLNALGTLYCAGFPVDILEVNGLSKGIHRAAPPGMPRYPFNREQSYWTEGRLSSNFRFPKVGRHNLLGSRSLDWNPQIAQWRNVLRLTENSWLEHHLIGGEVIFPGSGYLVMAIEALKQLVDSDALIHGVHIKDVTFSHPIRFPRGVEQVETQLTLSAAQQHASTHNSGFQFRIFVMDNGSYLECCSGSIIAAFSAQHRDRIVSTGPWAAQDWYDQIAMVSQKPITGLYVTSKSTEIAYGPAFRSLRNLRVGDEGTVIADLDTESWKSAQAKPSSPSYVVHPTTIDGMLQLVVPSMSRLGLGNVTTVPTRVSSLWIDCVSHNLHRGKLSVTAECNRRGYRGVSANIVGVAPDTTQPLIYLIGFETTDISKDTDLSSTWGVPPRKLCTEIVWKPDVELMSHEQILYYCIKDRPRQESDAVEVHRDTLLATMAFIEEAILFVDNAPSPLKLEHHLQFYINWMRHQQRRLRGGEISIDCNAVQTILQNKKAREQLIRRLNGRNAEGLFFMTIGRNIIDVLLNKTDPLQLMFEDGLANSFYEQMLANEHHAHPASAYIDLLCFRNPSMKILEVGAGTGGQTLQLLNKMSSDGVKKWARYDYTDISPSFFVQARAKFQNFVSKMSFKVCDISKDPTAQSFTPGSYDLVIASHVLHATDDLDESLRNIRKLLKKGGKFLLFETTDAESIIAVAFGLLKGWWSPLQHESRSEYSPCLTVEQWDERLRRTGFSGIDVEIPGQEEAQVRYTSIIFSTAVKPATSIPPTLAEPSSGAVVLLDERSEVQLAIAKILASEIAATNLKPCEVLTLAQLAEAKHAPFDFVISLLEVDSIFLDGISETDFLVLRQTLEKEKCVLWALRSQECGKRDPRHGLVDGLGRALMSEDSSRKFVTLSLDGWDKSPTSVAHLIRKLALRVEGDEVENVETKFIASDGVVQICRVRENTTMNSRIATTIQTRRKCTVQNSVDSCLSLSIDMPGNLETLSWTEDEVEFGKQPLGDEEVMIQVRAIGLTERDSLVINGQLNDRDLGIDCAGTVIAAGGQSRLQQGDRVCLVAPFVAKTIIRARSEALVSIPSHLSFAEACSVTSSLWTAFHALVNVARIQRGEYVLIHEGASCEGQMAIHLSRNLGVEVLVTVRSTSEREFLRKRLHIAEERIFSMNEGPLLSNIIRSTSQASGVDVVFGALADAHDDLDFTECLAPYGHLIDTSIRPLRASLWKTSSIVSNTSRSSIDMMDLLRRKPAVAYRAFQQAMEIAFQGPFTAPQPLRVFSANDIETAFNHLSNNTLLGKRVITLDPDMVLLANIKTQPHCTFPPNATYLISGGFGGLGRSVARWMVSRGARNLIILSRSGTQKPAAQDLVSELEACGIRIVAPKVDVGDLVALQSTLRELAQSMPPIRGCIQASFVLKDNLFRNMTYDDWTVSTRAKVAGSWNLHFLLPKNLDFFVLMSSVNGIFGGRGQANYAAGNTFQDALAHHRLQNGQRAVSINLGLMVAEGVVAENPALLASIRRLGHLMDIHQDELLALLDYYCDPSHPPHRPIDAQVIVGMEMPNSVIAKGIDLHHAIHRPMFRHLFQVETPSGKEVQGVQSATALDRPSLLAKAASHEDATAMVCEWFIKRVAQIVGLADEDIDPGKPLHLYGIDSLVAIDLKNWVSREIGAEIKVFSLLGNVTIQQVAEQAVMESRYRRDASLGRA